MPLQLSTIPGTFAIHRFEPGTPVPTAVLEAAFFTATRSETELSIVAPESLHLAAERTERGWACIRVEGPLDFDLVGILAGLTGVLAEAGISLFAISTFDTDYILVKADRLDEARRALGSKGHHFSK
ncbi:MAG: ACT domain-containing protein [Anaerolineales bacterium]|nr:ACT domain-containing protein [Anaerolineales bacterium]